MTSLVCMMSDVTRDISDKYAKTMETSWMIFGFFLLPKPAHDVKIMLLRRRLNVLTSFQHPCNVVLTSCAGRVGVED